MKRDMDLIREILLKIEEHPSHSMLNRLPQIEGYSEEDIYYHIWLLYDAGLIDAYDMSGGSKFIWYPKRITWEGYEFLEAARDKKRWDDAKKALLSKTGGLVFDILKALLINYAKGQVFGE